MNSTPKNLVQNKMKVRLSAEVFEAENSLGTYVTDGEDRFIIGSSKRADLVVPHDQISQIHAMLKIQEDEQILLYDLGSDGGTFVEGKKIVQRKLRSGEYFEIGNHKIRVDILLGKDGVLTDERALFWKSLPTSHDVLEVIHFVGGLAVKELSVARNKSLAAGKKPHQLSLAGLENKEVFLARKDNSGQHQVEGLLPAGLQGEVYDSQNKLLKTFKTSGEKFSFSGAEKIRLFSADNEVEVLVFWRGDGQRTQRSMADAESMPLKKALGGSLLLMAIIAAIGLVGPAKKEVIEEATIPKTSYLRVTMGGAAAPLGESDAKSESSSSEAKAETQNQAPSKVANLQNSLSKLLNKKSAVDAESLSQAISNNGKQTTRLAANSNMKSEAIAGPSGGGSGVNTEAMSAGLAGGSGTGTGSMKGFANGKIGGLGAGSAGLGGKGFNMSLGGDETEAIGGLDKSLIAAVVQANIGQIKHCYERQLILDPNIYGKIVAAWTIDKDGLVTTTSVKKTTMNSAPVENCILGKIKNWQFPKPKGGGQVLVSYPFLFKSLN